MDMVTSSETLKKARLDRERSFHDERFNEEVRHAQQKYYAAVQDAFADYEARREEYAQQADVLEYGCAKGLVSRGLAPAAESVTGIDISGVAIDQAREGALAAGLSNTRFDVMDAEAMDFPDESFDFIFGSGIIHHLDVEKSYAELRRVLRPGGRVLFIEPLGHNPALALYRKLTPAARTEDEHPLQRGDLIAFRHAFNDVRTRHYGLTTLAVTPLRNTRVAKAAFGTTRIIDRAIFAVPYAKWWAWFCVFEGTKY